MFSMAFEASTHLDTRGLAQSSHQRGMLSRKGLLTSARDIDFAQLTVDRSRYEAEMALQVTKRAHARKLEVRPDKL